MTPRPVSDYLTRFGGHDLPQLPAESSLPEPLPEPGPETSADDSMFELPASCGDEDVSGGRDESYERGFAEGLRELEESRRAERLAFDARLALERAGWAAHQGERLGERLDAALQEIETQIAASVATILRPFLGAAVRDKAVGELAESVGLMLSGKEQPMLQISGPDDLLAALRARWPKGVAAAEWTAASSVDVRIIADRTIIESRIERWMEWIETSSK